jgi:hypothetical protein
VASIRVLSQYMRCSRSILGDMLLVVQDIIGRDSAQYTLRTEALAVWMENFAPGVTEPVELVRVLLQCLISAVGCAGVGGSTTHYSPHTFPCPRSGDLTDFTISLLRCLHSLLADNKVRDPSELTAAVALPLAFQNQSRACATASTGDGAQSLRVNDLITVSRSVLVQLFSQNPKLLSRTLYLICIPPSTSQARNDSSDNTSHSMEVANHQSPSPAATPIPVLLYASVAPDQLLDIFKGIVSIVREDLQESTPTYTSSRNDGDGGGGIAAAADSVTEADIDAPRGTDAEPFRAKLDEVERALTEDALRTGSIASIQALKLLDVTPESARAIKVASDIGTLSSLSDSSVAKALRDRSLQFPTEGGNIDIWKSKKGRVRSSKGGATSKDPTLTNQRRSK